PGAISVSDCCYSRYGAPLVVSFLLSLSNAPPPPELVTLSLHDALPISDGSFATLLGASPGASTAVSIVTNLLKTCFPRQYGNWESSLKDMIPSLDRSLADDETLLSELSEYTARTLQLV